MRENWKRKREHNRRERERDTKEATTERVNKERINRCERKRENENEIMKERDLEQ